MDGKQPGADDIPDDVKRQFVRCEGYLDLKMADRAAQELSTIPAAYHKLPCFRCLSLHVLTHRKQWAEAMSLVKILRDEFPDEPWVWIQEAYITRRAEKSIEAARSILETALELFPDKALIHFNLSCYACQLGNLEEARQRLKDAIDLEDRWLKVALTDDDLEPLHEELEDWECT